MTLYELTTRGQSLEDGTVVLLGYATILAVIAAIDLTRRKLVLAG